VSIALALPGEGADGVGDGMIGFEGGGRRTTTRLLGGEFPRYQALLPNHVNSTAELSTGVLVEAVKRVALVAERNTAVRLAFAPGQLVLEAGTGEEAQAVEVIEASYDGDEFSIAFNPQYLLDGLSAIDSDTARMSFTEPGKPALITGKPAEVGQPDYRYLLMPIRLAG
jgi:DNA polymerase-3 subunit beta